MQVWTEQAQTQQRRSRLVVWFVLALSLVMTVACGETVRRRWYTGSCTGESSCGNDGLCLEGFCAQSCATQGDCDEGICLQKHCIPNEFACQYGYCEDGNACTDDLCTAANLQCAHPLHAGPCSDNDLCTVGDECVLVDTAATCKAAAKCDDGNPATQDSCTEGVCSVTP